jgi:hypothetical protein
LRAVSEHRPPSLCSRNRARGSIARRFAAALALTLSAPVLCADGPFDARVERAKRVEATPNGKAYVQTMWKQVGAYSSVALRECFRKGTPPDTPAFVLVANVLPDRSFARVDLQPRTPMAVCYVERLADAPFPKPPEIFGDAGIPIVIEMTIEP